MSSPAQEGTTAPKEKRGLGKMLSRMRTVWKRGESSKRQSTISAKAGPSTAAPAAPAAVASSSKPAAAETAKEPERPDVQATRVPKSQIYEERARKLAERYGIEIKPDEWHASGDALRVEKPIRMRVRRVCHVCQRPFGAVRECSNCGHPRCKDCGRYPPKRTEAEKEESRKRRAAILKERSENAPIIADWDLSEKKIVLKRPGKPGGQDLVHKKPRQRVRRTCHECHTVFLSGSKKCDSCGHVRCTDCPRDPAKRDKYPYGYPGDEFGPNAVPYYECHECKTTFPPDAADGTECSKCSHGKCSSCQRLSPRKIEPEPDPVIWQSLQAKLQAMHVT